MIDVRGAAFPEDWIEWWGKAAAPVDAAFGSFRRRRLNGGIVECFMNEIPEFLQRSCAGLPVDFVRICIGAEVMHARQHGGRYQRHAWTQECDVLSLELSQIRFWRWHGQEAKKYAEGQWNGTMPDDTDRLDFKNRFTINGLTYGQNDTLDNTLIEHGWEHDEDPEKDKTARRWRHPAMLEKLLAAGH